MKLMITISLLIFGGLILPLYHIPALTPPLKPQLSVCKAIGNVSLYNILAKKIFPVLNNLK